MQITCAKLQRRDGVLRENADKQRLNYCILACLLLPTLLIGGCSGLVSQDVKASNPQVYTLSGTISPTAGGSGATVTLSGAAGATTTANSSGAFSFTGLANGAYIITPIHTGYTLSPATQNATINGANVSGMSFTATAQVAPTYTISGTVSPSAGGSEATVTLSGASSASTTANSSGVYTFTGLADGAYTITPSHSGYTFSPSSQNATVNNANVAGLNFTATAQVAPTYSISGTISPTAGGSGATVTLSGAASGSTTANSSGAYSLTGLANGIYTVTPVNTGYTFAPASQAVTISGANVSGINFTASVVVQQAAGAPVLFFTDLIAGPATGNSDTTYSNNGGVYVTLYGNFLTSPTVTLNGAECLVMVSQPSTWMWYQKMTVQIGSTCTSGELVVTTANGTSNGLPFTVASSGHIYYAKGGGSDSAAGSFSAPWATLTHARDTISPGDTVYAETGSDAITNDGSGWGTSMLIKQNSTNGQYYAMIVYPGESVTIGSSSTSSIRSGDTIPTNYWIFAGFHLNASEVNAQWGSAYWRWIGNDATCPTGNGQEGCFEPIESLYTYVYGNNFHNMGVSGASAEYHGVYLATDTSEVDFGWNEIGFQNGGRGLQTHSEYNGSGTNGYGIWNISIHDNIIHDTGLDCIVGDSLSPNGEGTGGTGPSGSGTNGPGSGPVVFYNNVLYNCGQTTPSADTGDWSGIELTGVTTTGPGPSGTIHAFNNTIYAFGLNTNPPYGGSEYGILFNGGGSISATTSNNLLYSTRGNAVPYFGGSQTGTNNWMFNGPTTAGASGISGTIGTDPGLTGVTTFNFLPMSGSPVIGAGTPITGITPFGFNNIGRDILGNPRPATPSIGAYQ